jgi:hypothetical protein
VRTLNFIWRITVEKLALIAAAIGTVFWASTASAGWWDSSGFYHPTCYWVSNDKQQPKVEEENRDANQKRGEASGENPEATYVCY